MTTRSEIYDVIESDDFVILDTETTGLGEDAEIVEIAILQADGSVLLNTRVKPKRIIPSSATKVHGITNDMVADCLPFPSADIFRAIYQRNVIVYNAAFDLSMLYRSERAARTSPVQWRHEAYWWCAMRRFSTEYGEWNRYHNDYKWQTLATACRVYGIPVAGRHGALADCQMTLGVCKAMLTTEKAKLRG